MFRKVFGPVAVAAGLLCCGVAASNPPAPGPAPQPAVTPAVTPVTPPAPAPTPTPTPAAEPPKPLVLKVVAASGQTITTDEIPTLTMVEIAVDSPKKVLWFPPRGSPAPLDSGGKALTVFFPTAGEYRFVVAEQAEDGRGLDRTFKAVGPGPKPDPQVDPKVDPTPKPPGPGPATGFRVLFVWESSANNGREPLNILYSTKIAAYLNEKCVKVDGRPEWRRWDKDVEVVEKSETMKQLKAAAAASNPPPLPYLVIARDGAAETFPLVAPAGAAPVTEDSVLDLIKKKYEGGN